MYIRQRFIHLKGKNYPKRANFYLLQQKCDFLFKQRPERDQQIELSQRPGSPKNETHFGAV